MKMRTRELFGSPASPSAREFQDSLALELVSAGVNRITVTLVSSIAYVPSSRIYR